VTALAGVPAFVRAEFGEPVLRHATRAAMVDIESVEDPDCFIPHASMSGFVAEVARRSGAEHLGLMLAPHLSLDRYGCWGEFVLGAPTLGAAIDLASRSIGYHSRGDRVGLGAGSGLVALRYLSAARRREGYPQVAPAIVGVMLNLVRSYLPAAWRPTRIDLDLPPTVRTGSFEEAFGCPVRTGAPCLAVVFAANLLERGDPARRPARFVTLEDVARARSEPRTRDGLPSSVVALIHTQLRTGEVSLDRTAEMLDTSTRTLQRTLNRSGTDFRSLVNAVRIDRAKTLLHGSEASVTQISAELGYSAPAHFARAFRRQTGMAPEAYRLACGRDPAVVRGA
jgi:AraC-like DNA-binding protein